MKLRLALPVFLLACVAPAVVSAQNQTAPAAEKRAAKFHPLTGVIVEVMTEREALMVKHDEIPGVMRAMTMMFRVEAEVLGKVKKGDAIKAQMGRNEEGRWILRDVEVVESAK